MAERTTFKVGVNCFVVQDGKLLLGLRRNIFGDGTWGLPGGHLELGESILHAAKRELFEETGLQAIGLQFVNLVNDARKEEHRLQIGIEVLSFSGELHNNEPGKCRGLEWFDLSALPDALFIAHVRQIQAFVKNQGPLVE